MRLSPSRGMVAAMLFTSGLCALIYQTVWLREFRLIFGASTAASAAVLGIFMGGLGLGSAFLGKRSESTERPLLLYGKLELWIALAAASTPFLLWLVRTLYTATGGSMQLGNFVATVLRLLLSSLVLIVPTFLMGGTLPAVARAVSKDADVGRRSLALLYGCNTIGAVVGVALSTFCLIEWLGNRGTLWLACTVNVLVALIAIVRGRKADAVVESSPEIPETTGKEGGEPVRFVMLCAAGVGFAFMFMELVWYRMLSPLLGGSTFTFGVILLVALLGVGIGGMLYAFFGQDKRPTINGFALSCALEAFLIAVPFALGDRIAFMAGMLRGLGGLGFGGQILGWGAITGIVVFPAAVVAGYQFPMLIALLGGGKSGVGRHTGLAYAANTGGAIAGSLAGGFGLLPLLTAPGAWKAVVILLVVIAMIAVGKAMAGRQRPAFTAVMFAMIAITLLFCQGPTAVWRHGSIGVGRAPFHGKTINELEEWAGSVRRSVVWEEEGVESSVAVRANTAYHFVINGKSDGNAIGDSGTQVMGGLVGSLLHPSPKRSMVIGLGTGSTAGWLGVVPEMEHVDVVELEPSILKVARMCAPVNRDVLNNPKVKIYLGDAREALLATRQTYDIIFSEPSNPFRAGIASLFTRDFYEAASARLNKNGIFLQWVQGYEIDGIALQTVYATLLSVFPYVQTWQTQGGDLLMVATREPLPVDIPRLEARVAQEPYRSAILAAWRVFDVNGVLGHYVGNEKLAHAAAGAGVEIATDDKNNLEFGFARGVGSLSSESIAVEACKYAAARQWNRPLIVGGEVDWAAVEATWFSGWKITHMSGVAASGDPETIKARHFFAECMKTNDFASAVAVWSKTPFEPSQLEELEFLVMALMSVSDPRMQGYYDKLRGYSSLDAEALQIHQLASQKKWDEAADLLSSIWQKCQTNPWVSQRVLQHIFHLTTKVMTSGIDTARIEKLGGYLFQPLAVENMRTARLEQGMKIMTRLSKDNYAYPGLIQALDAMGVYYPWTEEMLLLRAKVYRVRADSRLQQAVDDLVRYRAQEAAGFSRGMDAK